MILSRESEWWNFSDTLMEMGDLGFITHFDDSVFCIICIVIFAELYICIHWVKKNVKIVFSSLIASDSNTYAQNFLHFCEDDGEGRRTRSPTIDYTQQHKNIVY